MKKYMKYVTFLAVIALFGVFIFRKGSPLHDIRSVLQQARWEWLLLALVWQAMAYGAVTTLNKIILQHYGADVPWSKQYVIQLAMAFIEAAVPSATISGAVLRVRLLKPHGVSADVATVSTVVEMILIVASIIFLAIPVFVVVAIGGLQGKNILQQEILLLLSGVLSAGAMVVLWRTERFKRIVHRVSSRVSLFWDNQILPRWHHQLGEWSSQVILSRARYLSSEAITLIKIRPYAIGGSLLARSAFEALGLMMCFYALGQNIPLLTMLLIYTLTVAINSLGAVPGGVGLAEVSLAVLYAQFGISPETAVIVALAYRLTDYWLPRVAGGASWLWLERRYPKRVLHVSQVN